MVIITNGNTGIGATPTTSPNDRLVVVNAHCDGNNWINSSDRNLKENFTPVDVMDVLDRVAALPIARWNYKSDSNAPHMGPVAQDFRAAFQLGIDDKGIATVDEGGVALAAIQGLNEKVGAENAALRAENEGLKKRLERIEHMLAPKEEAAK